MTIKSGSMSFGPRRAVYIEAQDLIGDDSYKTDRSETAVLEDLDLIYRTLCGVLYNYVPTSGHPGGSISSGRIVESLLYKLMDYDIGDPDDISADIISYAAGHKAMGLYAMWALRNEICRQFDGSLLPKDERQQLRLEDLLGFRRNPCQHTPLFKKFNAKALDGHPSPLVPFVKLSTGASGVGVPSSFGLGFGARDYFGRHAPLVHVIEGEGGLTPGRTHEAMAAAATAQVNNIILHLDWNQSSIDSDSVCREGEKPGEYVQWDPKEYGYLHDWNVINVKDGFNFEQIIAAQKAAVTRLNDQPTMIVYRTVKGWRYGIEGAASHGAGHKFCSDDYYNYLKPFEERFKVSFPRFEGDQSDGNVEQVFYDTLMVFREAIGSNSLLLQNLGQALKDSASRLKTLSRKPRSDAPDVSALYDSDPGKIPAELLTEAGKSATLRGSLGSVLNYLNKASGGSMVVCAADLYGSTSIKSANKGFPDGFWNAVSNPGCRVMSVGGICEDAMGALMSGISAYGKNIGVASSYGAFIASLTHIASRLHGIGQQGTEDRNDTPFNPYMVVCAHAGLKTGEDGPTHADPQPLQLLQENFPAGIMITLTPWDPNEMWPLVVEALRKRPAVIAPFVTRPKEKIFDRKALNLPPVEAALKGIYAFRREDPERREYHGSLILQGSGVTNTFVEEVLPKIDEAGYNMNIYYVASAELFNALSLEEQLSILPRRVCEEAMGITGFTMPTMYKWILSEEGRRHTLAPFNGGRYLGSGKAHKVLEEVGLHGQGQWAAVREYVNWAFEHCEQENRSVELKAVG